MQTEILEIAPDVYRLSTFLPDVAPPAGFSFNQFLILAEEPMLFHCGHRSLFPLVSEAFSRVLPVERLRWISFGHLEADECGSMNLWLGAAPHAQVMHGALGCNISLNDMADRLPRPLTDQEVVDLGGKRVRWLQTPHVPHGWEAGVIFEETSQTLFCGDLLTQAGHCPALVESDIVGAAIGTEDVFHSMCLGPNTGPMITALANLAPKTLAVMHGSSFAGNGQGALNALSEHYGSGARGVA